MKTPYGYITISIRIVLFIRWSKQARKSEAGSKLYFAIVVREEENFLSKSADPKIKILERSLLEDGDTY